MLNKNLLVGIVVTGAVALDLYLMLTRKKQTPDYQKILEDTEPHIVQIEDLFPEPDEDARTAHLVYCRAPWGEPIPVFFSAQQWQMLHQLSEMSGQELEEIICEVAAERYMGNRNFPPEDPFPPF